MAKFDNIYLIGLMGAGKTTIGKQLANNLDLPFYDSDKVIEENTGVSIPTIFEIEGESGFRDREYRVIKELTQLNGVILATGGGAIVRRENFDLLKEKGFVVYLKCSIDRILDRTKRDSQRPLLQTENPRAKLEQLLIAREPLYLSCADFTIDSGAMQSKTVVKKIISKYNSILENQSDEDVNR